MTPSRKKCGRCHRYQLDCIFDTPEATEAARDLEARDPTQAAISKAHRRKRTSHHSFEDLSLRLMVVEVVCQIPDLKRSTTFHVADEYTIRDLRECWCSMVGISSTVWNNFYIKFNGTRLANDQKCRMFLREPEADGWRIEATVEAHRKVIMSPDRSWDRGHNEDVRESRHLEHSTHALDTTPDSDRDGGKSPEICEEIDVNEAHGEMHSDLSVQRKLAVKIISSRTSQLGSSSATFDVQTNETIDHVIKRWCEQRFAGIRPFWRPDVWLACGQRILEGTTCCEDILTEAHEVCPSTHTFNGAEDEIFLQALTFEDIQHYLHLRRDIIDIQLISVNLRRKQRDPEVAGPLATDPFSEPTTVTEPCNGIHEELSRHAAGVKLILFSRIPGARLMTFYRKETQRAAELLRTWNVLHAELHMDVRHLVLVRDIEALGRFATWSSICSMQQRYVDEKQKKEVRPIYLEVMTVRMVQDLLTTEEDREKIEERNARFAEGLRARGGRPSPVLGKRQRDSF